MNMFLRVRVIVKLVRIVRHTDFSCAHANIAACVDMSELQLELMQQGKVVRESI